MWSQSIQRRKSAIKWISPAAPTTQQATKVIRLIGQDGIGIFRMKAVLFSTGSLCCHETNTNK